MKKTLILAVILLCFYSTAIAEETKKEGKKQSISIVFDIPLTQNRKAVDIDRIRDGNVQIGPLLEPWESEISFGYLRSLRFGIYSENSSVTLEGNFGKNKNTLLREIREGSLTVEESIWYILTGIGMSAERDLISGMPIPKTDFVKKYKRLSYGGKAWVGVKIGKFNDDFIVFRAGRGLLIDEASNIYTGEGLANTEYLPIYKEIFYKDYLSVEGRLNFGFIAFNGRLDDDYYRRKLPSPDPYFYGAEKFRDLTATATVEVAPLINQRTLRLLIVGQKNFTERNSLQFRTDNPNIQFLLRIALK